MRLIPTREGVYMEEERKRLRPISSLYIPSTGNKQQTVPNLTGGKPKPNRLQIKQQMHRQQLVQQEQQNMRLPYRKPTRAQGGGAGPPRKLYSPTEEANGYGGDRPRKRSPYYRDKNGKVIRDEPEHLRAMMEDGIPVKQWLVLLVLLVVGLYQLRKTVLGPSVNDKASKKPSSPKKLMKGKKTGKQKGKKNASGKGQVPRSAPKTLQKQPKEGNDTSVPVKSEASRSISTLTTEVEAGAAPSEKESIAPKKDATPPVEVKKTKASKKKKKTASQPQKTKKDVNVTDEQDSTQNESPAVPLANGPETTVESGDRADDVDGDGWQTVGQGTVSEQNMEKNVRVDPGAQDVVDKVVNPTVMEETNEKSESVAPREPTAPAMAESDAKATENNAKKNGKAKKKKKNGTNNENGSIETGPAKVEEASAPIPPAVASTEDDAALALKLQEEEERFANAISQPAGEDSWAEVTPKKSRRPTAAH